MIPINVSQANGGLVANEVVGKPLDWVIPCGANVAPVFEVMATRTYFGREKRLCTTIMAVLGFDPNSSIAHFQGKFSPCRLRGFFLQPQRAA